MFTANTTRTTEYHTTNDSQNSPWASVGHGGIENSLQIVSENLAETLDLQSTQKILDIAAGSGNFTAAAASRWADTTSTDIALPVLKCAESRLRAQGLDAVFGLADVANLPYLEDTFDITASTFGVMFCPDKNRAAQEMIRVTKPGGKIGLVNWTPEGFMGHLLNTIEHYTPSVNNSTSTLSISLDWGEQPHLKALFADAAIDIQCAKKVVSLRFRSPDHWLSLYHRYYAPLTLAYAKLDHHAVALLTRELLELVSKYNIANDATVTLPCEYLECVIQLAGKPEYDS